MAKIASSQWIYFGQTSSPGYGLPGEWEHLGSFTSLFPVNGIDMIVRANLPVDRYQLAVRGLYNNVTNRYEQPWVTIWSVWAG